MPPLTPLLLVAASLVAYSADAFSAPASPSDGIKIVGLPGGKIESLPGMYVQSFRRWIVDGDDRSTSSVQDEKINSCPLKIEPIKGAGLSNLPMDEGWVNPTTTNDLWWPRDLSKLQIRPMLNVLFRNAQVSYVSVGLDVRVPHITTQSNNNNGDDVVSWRNYGLNSQPIARQWTTLDIAMERMFHVEGFVLHNNNEEEEQQHVMLFPSLDVKDALLRLATFIAELDSLSPIAEGFHIASFPLDENWTDLPNPEDSKNEKGENSTHETDVIYKIVCLATSEPFANKLLDMDEDILTMSSTSVLEVAVSRTAKGGDSPYLTEPYKSLYLNE
ncbi:hypothetical protein ACHAXR_007097 [Thalassiosira sp. AJA248-18]